MSPEKESLLTKYIRIFFVVSGYWIISIVTVFVNKTLLSDIELNAPMFIALYQTSVATIIIIFMKTFGKILPNVDFPETSAFKWTTIKDVLPLTIMFTAMIATNNLCLKFVSVAFYYVGRSLTTIFNVIFTYLILGEKTSKICVFFCFVIISGFLLGVDQEQLSGSFSITGTIFGVAGSLSLSLYSIFNKRVLPRVDQNVWVLSYYNNIYSSVLFFLLMIFNGEVQELADYKLLFTTYFWGIMTVGGICGFLINIMTSLQIKYTSALTHNISGTAKACAQTILATHWYHESKSALWWLSNAVVLFGSAGYARIKQLDMQKTHRSSAAYQKV